MFKKVIFLTCVVSASAFATPPSEGKLAARVSAAALAKEDTLDVVDRAGGPRVGGLLGMVTNALTGASGTVTKDEADRWVNVRNPCTRDASTVRPNSAEFDCKLQIKYFNDEALVVERFKYRTKIEVGSRDDDYTATLLSRQTIHTKTVTEGQ